MQKVKPVIGMNANFRSEDGDQPSLSYISAGYFDAVSKAGGIPVIIPPLEEAEEIEQILDRLDGVVLIGGADLDPCNDGFVRHPTVRPMDKRRETFDRMLIDIISRRRTPVYGVGVGLQLLNLSQGGNLFFHLPEDIPEAFPHKDQLDPGHRHALEIIPDSLMGRVYGDGEIRVNSMHHMAIDEVASGFVVTARSPDGVVEAIESVVEDWFAFGTQFHPEASSASALDGRIFEEFVTGIASGGECREKQAA